MQNEILSQKREGAGGRKPNIPMPIPQSRTKAFEPRSKSPVRVDPQSEVVSPMEGEQQLKQAPQLTEVEKSVIRL